VPSKSVARARYRIRRVPGVVQVPVKPVELGEFPS
jgi:hypothetical protein